MYKRVEIVTSLKVKVKRILVHETRGHNLNNFHVICRPTRTVMLEKKTWKQGHQSKIFIYNYRLFTETEGNSVFVI